MTEHWDTVRNVLDVLVHIVKDGDPDGPELYFTISRQWKRSKKTAALLELLQNKSHRGATDITLHLNELIETYKDKLDHGPSFISSILRREKGVRPLSLYILTNGIWEERSKPDALIIMLVQKLLKIDKTRHQVGIQFISFGNDLRGLERMRKLDMELGEGRDPENWL
jgi:hypothetical protein